MSNGDPSIASQTMSTLSLEQSRLRIRTCTYLIPGESCGQATLDSRGRLPIKYYAGVPASSHALRIASFRWHHGIPPPQLHHRALITPDSHNMAIFEPRSVKKVICYHISENAVYVA